MLIVNSRKTSLQTKEKVSESFSPEYFLPFCHITSLVALSRVALNMNVFAPKTNIKSCLLGVLC